MKKQEMDTKMVPLNTIHLAERIRQDIGSLEELARDIQEHGLLNPITVMEQTGGGYVLIAGLRRMKAVEMIGKADIRATVMSPMEADEALMLEISENERRKDFTTSERLAFAERIKAVETEKGRQRMLHGKLPDDPVGMCPRGIEKGKVRDIVAHKAGFGSARQMRRAQELADTRPDLMQEVDQGNTTIGRAYRLMHEGDQSTNVNKPETLVGNRNEENTQEEREGFIHEETVDIPFYAAYQPNREPAPGNVRTVKGADHEHLLENPIYRRLFESYNDAVQQVNLARGEMRTRCEGYERRIRGYRENIQALQQQLARLQETQHA